MTQLKREIDRESERIDALIEVYDAIECRLGLKPLAPAVYVGPWDCPDLDKRLELWNLTADIPGHCKDSTVTETTLRQAGYAIPSRRLTEAELVLDTRRPLG